MRDVNNDQEAVVRLSRDIHSVTNQKTQVPPLQPEAWFSLNFSEFKSSKPVHCPNPTARLLGLSSIDLRSDCLHCLTARAESLDWTLPQNCRTRKITTGLKSQRNFSVTVLCYCSLILFCSLDCLGDRFF